MATLSTVLVTHSGPPIQHIFPWVGSRAPDWVPPERRTHRWVLRSGPTKMSETGKPTPCVTGVPRASPLPKRLRGTRRAGRAPERPIEPRGSHSAREGLHPELRTRHRYLEGPAQRAFRRAKLRAGHGLAVDPWSLESGCTWARARYPEPESRQRGASGDGRASSCALRKKVRQPS